MKTKKVRREEKFIDFEEIKVALVGYFNLPVKKDAPNQSIYFRPDIEVGGGTSFLRGINFVIETIEEVKEEKTGAN